jgi:hypothetical protein
MSVDRLAVQATNHCLTGCGIGEVLGMVLATWWGWGDAASIALAVALAFFFGYLLTLVPLLRAGTALGVAVGIALVADTLSITTRRSSTTLSWSCGQARWTRTSTMRCSGSRLRSPSRWRGGRRSWSIERSSDAGRAMRARMRRMATSTDD